MRTELSRNFLREICNFARGPRHVPSKTARPGRGGGAPRPTMPTICLWCLHAQKTREERPKGSHWMRPPALDERSTSCTGHLWQNRWGGKTVVTLLPSRVPARQGQRRPPRGCLATLLVLLCHFSVFVCTRVRLVRVTLPP